MSDAFRAPVRILVGLGFPQDVCSAIDAVVYLDSVPQSSRDYSHSLALKACKAALRGEIEAETAQGMFKVYAAKQGILAPSAENLLSGAAASGRVRHTL